MSNLLFNYLNKRTTEKDLDKKTVSNYGGPVISISRQVGCDAVGLAEQIVSRLNSGKPKVKWKVISKEIFHETAKELQMDPKEVIKTLHQSEKYSFDDVLKGFSSKKHASDLRIEKTIKRVILHIAVDGYCIMVGRAVHILAKDIKNALHIRLVAPLDYRINSIMQKNQLNKEEAIEYIQRVDKERKAYRKSLLKKDPQNKLFDLTVNRSSFTDEEIVDIVEFAALKKNISKNS